MRWLSRLAGLTEYLTLDVLMKFDIWSGQGIAALRWMVTRPHSELSEEQCRIALVALLYARILVIHHETRGELFDRMARAARAVLQGEGTLTFDPWELHVAGRNFAIWPWILTEAGRVADAKTYTSTLYATALGFLNIHFKMAVGQERVLAPSVVLIAVSELATALNDSNRTRLAAVLLEINTYYQSSAHIRLGSERFAFAAAMPMLLGQEVPPLRFGTGPSEVSPRAPDHPSTEHHVGGRTGQATSTQEVTTHSLPTIQCWRCKASITVTPAIRGRKIRCPSCRTKQAMPL